MTLERAEEVKSPDPSLPMAKLTALGWILRGAFRVSRQLITASAFGVHANERETFDLQTIYELLSFDFAKFWSEENVGISKTKAKPTKLTASALDLVLEFLFQELLSRGLAEAVSLVGFALVLEIPTISSDQNFAKSKDNNS